MATTSSTTGTTTATPTPTPTAASLASATAKQLLGSLGSDSSIDTAALVTSLVQAQFAAKTAQLTAKTDTLTAQISGVSTLKSTISDFTKALENLVKGGTLATQPVSSNGAAVGVSALAGATLSGLSATVKVNQLAAAQTATSTKIATPSTTTFGTGTFTLQLGTAGYAVDGTMNAFAGTGSAIPITIDSSNNTLAGIAAAINAKKAGVTASVVTDADGGAYLALKGATGAAQGFQLAADDAASPLAQFDVRPGATTMTIASQAKNAQLAVDGVPVERASNEISDLIAGVKLNLGAIGTSTLTSSRPTAALTNSVKDFVETYNQVIAVVKEQTDPITGKLRADPAAKNLLRTMQAMTNRVLLPNAAPGSPATLSAIGVRTTRTGTLEIDEAALTRAMTNTPEAVEAMFTFSSVSGTGLYSAMQSLDFNAASTVYGLGASATRYRQAQSDLSKQKDKVSDQSERLTTRLTQQYSSMNSRVLAYKSTQSFMEQQIAAWTKSN